MIVTVYLVASPGSDRVYVQSTPPLSIERTPGMRIYRLESEIPDFMPIDGKLHAMNTEDVTESLLGSPAPL